MPEKQKRESQKHDSRFGIRVAPAVASVIAGIAAPATAHGGVILSNAGDPQIDEGFLIAGMPLAQAFLTGPLAATVFSINIELLPEKSSSTGTFTASLYTDMSGSPGSDIADSAPIGGRVGDSSLDFTFLFTSPVPLAANTMYWVVASNSKPCGPSCYDWITTNSSAQTSDVGATFHGDLETFNGASWVNATGLSPSVGLMAIDAPEPGGFSLAALGGALLAWIARLGKRSQKVEL